MNNTLDVIFLGYDDARHARLAEALSHLGFNVRRCNDLAKVYERYFRRPCPLIVLEAPLPDIHNAAVRLRAADRGLGIVAISPFPDAESRIRTLLCGADACLPPDVTGLELAAALQALVRRAAIQESADVFPEAHAPMEAAQETWRLANKGWTLVSPDGRTLGLTTGERDFLSRLVDSPDRKVSRDAFHADGADETDSGITRRRFVDVMISRLRRKAAAHHMALPIRAVHGWGYMFAADIAFDLEFRAVGEESRMEALDDWRREMADASS
ncbi:winged helix-turn-helix domain-containing protein [Achromobacter veterisilvae]|jgi:two-component system OmpR family response regulator|uniref:Transcriptional regulatory protein OmpR n=1 Tax=Achromobacter veterisilvae TaxID=2069367 RepID=A0A446CBI0_9BURK|nr:MULTISPECIES: winged helix-turn-helix domain-containing protein [Achromobacter]MCW0209318.1 winged helix-turn-helix domain-containing protein [Achromobacter sp.]SSW65207.1 Transcriptional regulatory protein OmpR [Achromobacter veterisilvae]